MTGHSFLQDDQTSLSNNLIRINDFQDSVNMPITRTESKHGVESKSKKKEGAIQNNSNKANSVTKSDPISKLVEDSKSIQSLKTFKMEENSARQNFEIKKKMVLNYKEGVTKNRPKIKFKKINISSMNL